VGAAAARELASDYILRLSDVRPIDSIIADGPRKDQNATAPLPALLPAPHESMVADVSDAEAVMRACAGMDAVVNCTVIRVILCWLSMSTPWASTTLCAPVLRTASAALCKPARSCTP